MQKVKGILTSKDGQSRGAEVRVQEKGSKGTSLVRRPLQLLYPLEVSCSANADTRQEQLPDLQEPSPQGQVTGRRERRRAAVEGDRLRRQGIAELQDEH